MGFGFIFDHTKGCHHFYVHPDVPEVVNIQEVKGEAKAYQIRQFLKLVERYNLILEEEHE